MAEIKVQNIYHMLSYAYQILLQKEYRKTAAENFDHIDNLLSAILARGVSQQIKRGLHRDYLQKCDDLAGIRGQILLGESIKRQTSLRGRLACSFDEFASDTTLNRILKCTMKTLLRQGDLRRENKTALRRLLPHFGGIQDISPARIDFDQLRFHRNNASYRMLMGICRFVIQGLLLTSNTGEHRLPAWQQGEQMHRLYEKFLLAYYRKHMPQLSPKDDWIHWDLPEGSRCEYLPKMHTDITLSGAGKTLIIDAKWHSVTMPLHYGRHRFKSADLYQIYTYVKNKDIAGDGSVSGILLYAKTEEGVTPDADIIISGSPISLRSLNLNCAWDEITQQLDGLAAPLIT